MIPSDFTVRKIVVFGAGIVGVPMAAGLARARIRLGTDDPARVVLVQRDSPTSGWKVGALNAGRSPIGGIEPGLEAAVAETVREGLLRASPDAAEARDADVILFCVQTDKRGFGPDYGPLFEAMTAAAQALATKSSGRRPLVVFESTLAPTSMSTVVRDLFAAHGLEDGRDILLGNSPNRVMPGFLLERIRDSDKLVGGLRPETPPLIEAVYKNLVTRGRLLLTSSVTAETVKTLENAYRDVRIAYAAEVVRSCDALDIEFDRTRDAVNARLGWDDSGLTKRQAVPTGGLLVPNIGVGGHCLPKDGILLLWRMIERGADVSSSLILESRRINDASPGLVAARIKELFGPLAGGKISLLGASYRPNSEDTRNSPTLALALQLLGRGGRVIIHDPYVRPEDQNLAGTALSGNFTRDLDEALSGSEIAVFCVSHRIYRDGLEDIIGKLSPAARLFDGCHLAGREAFGKPFPGIGKGKAEPPAAFIEAVTEGFRAVERGVALEIDSFVRFINEAYPDPWNHLDLNEIRALAGTCPTECRIAAPGPVALSSGFEGFNSRLSARAVELSRRRYGGEGR